MSEHTPGPWFAERPYKEPGLYVTAAPNTALIARVWNDNEANARLIAAAPELLKALERLVLGYDCNDYCDDESHLEEFDDARAAIALASPQESEVGK